MNRCWCGNTKLENYSQSYWICKECGTLISKFPFSKNVYQVEDEENDLYGENNWKKFMIKEAEVASIDEMIDLYLHGRAPYWLKYILKYIPFGGNVAEIGCGLGQLSYLLKMTNYRQMAYELSPAVCKYVHKSLGINIVSNPFGDMKEKYDAILAFDVFEHIMNPEEFLVTCKEKLNDSGIIVLQTPCFDSKLSYDEMLLQKPRFQNLLVEEQHVYLYSQEAIVDILSKHGINYVCFEKAYFGEDYDMFLFASKNPLAINDDVQVNKFLNELEVGRVIKANIFMAISDLEKKLYIQRLEQDSWNRLNQVEKLTTMLNESEIDRAARLEQINQLTEMLKESEDDREARLEQINSLSNMLKESENDRWARLEQINQLHFLLKDKE